MARETSSRKPPLSAERILDGAMTLADEIGIDSFTIRKLADALDTKPMTIYHHIPSKDAIVDGMVDRIFAEIERPPVDLPWKAAMRHRCLSVRSVLARHPWATPLMESRTSPGAETLGHHDAVLGCLRRGGLSLVTTAHAYALIDSYVYGFALQEAGLPATSGSEMADLAGSVMEPVADDVYPYLTEFTTEYVLRPGYDFRSEFEYGLDLVLDALEAQVSRETPQRD